MRSKLTFATGRFFFVVYTLRLTRSRSFKEFAPREMIAKMNNLIFKCKHYDQ